MSLEFRKVVAVIDVDDQLAPHVLEAAVSLAGTTAALHAIDSNPFITTFESPYAAGALEADAAAHKADADRRRDALKAMIDAAGVTAELAILEVNPSRDAASYAKKIGADLIVIGSHQKGWLKRILEGSESADMIREAPCAVFVVTQAHVDRKTR